MVNWTDELIMILNSLVEVEDLTWTETSEYLNENYAIETSANSCRKAYYRYKDVEFSDEDFLKNAISARVAKKRAGIELKKNNILLDQLQIQNDFLSEFNKMIKGVKFTKPKPKKKTKSKKKKNMTTEHMISDLHYGKATDSFNYAVARERMSKLAEVTIEEFDRYSKNFNVEQSVIFLGGDIIEGATIHGVESRMCSEAGNADQIKNAIISLYEDYLVPIINYGHKIKIVAVCGNHDRDGKDKTYNKPGKESFTWTIYHTLAQLCKVSGAKNVEFVIPEGIFHIENIYGSNVLYEHGDHVKGRSKQAYESHMAKRGVQNDVLIDFLRMGHFHERCEYGRGRIIINPSLAGQDSYSEIHGFNSEAAQTINYYVETKKRANPFYHSFCVYLDEEL